MNKENKALLESLIKDRLNKAMQEGNPEAFDEAMKAIDRQLEFDKKELEMTKEEMKQKFEMKKEENRQHFELDKEDGRQQFELDRDETNRKHELKRDELRNQFELEKEDLINQREQQRMEAEAKQANKDRIIKCVEIAAAVIATPLIEAGCKKAFAHMLCEFEKDYNFTTMAGKSLSGLFKFRK